jgi:hypothetical protein
MRLTVLVLAHRRQDAVLCEGVRGEKALEDVRRLRAEAQPQCSLCAGGERERRRPAHHDSNLGGQQRHMNMNIHLSAVARCCGSLLWLSAVAGPSVRMVSCVRSEEQLEDEHAERPAVTHPMGPHTVPHRQWALRTGQRMAWERGRSVSRGGVLPQCGVPWGVRVGSRGCEAWRSTTGRTRADGGRRRPRRRQCSREVGSPPSANGVRRWVWMGPCEWGGR